MLQEPIVNDDTESLNGSTLDSSSLMNESVLDPEDDSFNDDLNTIIPTTPTISNSAYRDKNRSILQSERREIADAKLRSGVGMTSFPYRKPGNYINHYKNDNHFQHKSSYSHYRDQFGHDRRLRKDNFHDGRSDWEDVYDRSKPPTNRSLTPGDYLGSTRPGHYNRDRHRRRRGYREEDSVDSDGDSMCNDHGNWDGPILTAVATPVPEKVEIDKPDKVIKRTLCVQKLLIIIIFILIAIACGATIYGYQAGYFANGTNSPTDVQSNPVIDQLSTTIPSNHPTIFNSESPTQLKSQDPTMTTIPPVSTNNPTFVVSLMPSTAPTVTASSLLPTGASSLKPSNLPSHSPSYFPSILPSTQPSITPPTLAPTKGCEAWCVNHPTPWRDTDPTASQKCKWPKTCGGCPQCDNNCKLWCANHPVPWWDEDPGLPQKCHWEENCAGCPECYDPAFNYGSAGAASAAVFDFSNVTNLTDFTNFANVENVTNVDNTTDRF